MKPDRFAREVARKTLATLEAFHHYRLLDAQKREVVAFVTTPASLNAILKGEPREEAESDG